MDHNDHFFAFFILLSLSQSFSMVHGHRPCSQTPYPLLCNSLIEANKQLLGSYKTNLSFRDIAFKVALDQAREAHQLISSMYLDSINDQAKLAWEDCQELYEDSVHQLNKTISSKTTLDNTQTYLSATIANHETCKDGFNDLKLSSHLDTFPPILTNLSKLLANAISINQASTTSTRGGRRLLATRFPSWVSKVDRKLIKSTMPTTKVDLVVAKDGTGDYNTISEAIVASKKLQIGTKRFIIYVKKGVYKENVVVTKNMKNLMLIGDGIGATIVTGNRNVQDGYTTFRSATFAVAGDGFMAKGMTFENTSGPSKHQAVALRSGSDFSVFYNCSFNGYQDTLYVHSKRQFYKHCQISGTVDFIFGDAISVFQSCSIYVRNPLPGQVNTITAQGRSDPNENTGIIIHDSVIQPHPDLIPLLGSVRSFLGRPWKKYSRTLVMKSYIDGFVDPTGWIPWSSEFDLDLETLYYGEYMNIGFGSSTSGRVKWPGYHVITSPLVAGKFTVGTFLAGDRWIPATGVPFTSGL